MVLLLIVIAKSDLIFNEFLRLWSKKPHLFVKYICIITGYNYFQFSEVCKSTIETLNLRGDGSLVFVYLGEMPEWL